MHDRPAAQAVIYPGALIAGIAVSIAVCAVGVRLADRVRDETARAFWVGSTALLSFLVMLTMAAIGGGLN